MTIIFFVPLTCIAIWESLLENGKNHFVKDWFAPDNDDEFELQDAKDPEVEEESGARITKVPFNDLVSIFPNAYMVRRGIPIWNSI